MSFGPIPQAVSIAIQQNFLQREFEKALLSVLKYRLLATKETFSARIGETITKTRVGLMIPNLNPLNPQTNTNLDNGLSPSQYTSEQYTLGVAQYPQLAPDVNLADNQTTIADFIMKNAFNLGYVQAQVTERLSRNALFNAYLSGNTRVTATLGAPATTVEVDDTRGFQTVVVNGVVTAVSPSNPLPVKINGVTYSVTGYANDSVNVSSAAVTGGTSGTITTSANVSTTNGTAGNSVIGTYAPLVLRPNARATTAALTGSDILDMPTCFAAVSALRSNGVPDDNGFYNFLLSPDSMTQLFNDTQFQILNRGVGTQDPNYKHLNVTEFLGMRFIPTTEAFVQPDNGNGVSETIQRPIVCGKDLLIEGQFDSAKDAILEMIRSIGPGEAYEKGQVFPVAGYDGYWQYMRGPLDRLGQIISQTSNWIGGYVVPTDVGTTSQQIPTASQAYYKRAVIIETAS